MCLRLGAKALRVGQEDEDDARSLETLSEILEPAPVSKTSSDPETTDHL